MAGQRVKRSRLDIVSEILSEALGGIRKTQLMYRANLSFKRREKYVKDLISLGLIEIRSGSFTAYITTKRGQEWLKNYEKIKL
jgi:predicted transcriptional regulator